MTPKKAIIIGATSGIGYQVACLLLKEGWTLGIAGRREDRLEAFRQKAPERIYVQRIDILEADADQNWSSSSAAWEGWTSTSTVPASGFRMPV